MVLVRSAQAGHFSVQEKDEARPPNCFRAAFEDAFILILRSLKAFCFLAPAGLSVKTLPRSRGKMKDQNNVPSPFLGAGSDLAAQRVHRLHFIRGRLCRRSDQLLVRPWF